MLVNQQEALDRIACIRANVGFRTFVALLDFRIQHGGETDAYRMLTAIGAEAGVAHQVVNEWPRKSAARLAAVGISLEDECSWRLACFIPDFERHDWTKLLSTAALAACRARVADRRLA